MKNKNTLRELLGELEKPKNIYQPGIKAPSEDDENIAKAPFKLKNTVVDPETGKSTSDVEYLPEFHKINVQLIKYRKDFQQFKYSNNPDIAELSKKISSALTKIINAVTAVGQMVDREQRKYK